MRPDQQARLPPSRKGRDWIDGRLADADLEVQMRTRRVAGRADVANWSTGQDSGADTDVDRREVSVERAHALGVSKEHRVAPVGGPAGRDDCSCSGRRNTSPGRGRNIDAGVETRAAGTEQVGNRQLKRP